MCAETKLSNQRMFVKKMVKFKLISNTRVWYSAQQHNACYFLQATTSLCYVIVTRILCVFSFNLHIECSDHKYTIRNLTLLQRKCGIFFWLFHQLIECYVVFFDHTRSVTLWISSIETTVWQRYNKLTTIMHA